mgnify:CR=1 FL=1
MVAGVVADNNVEDFSISSGNVKGFVNSMSAALGVRDSRPFFDFVIDEFSKGHLEVSWR